jgi:hypothetical protein
MIINLRGVKALQQLRIEQQESAGLDFPESCHTELLVLYDVCKYLELNIFQAQHVLGAQGYAYVTGYINGTVTVNSDKVAPLLEHSQPLL